MSLSDKIIKISDEVSGFGSIHVEDVKEFIKKLKEGNNNQRKFHTSWKLLSKEELIIKLNETLDAFDRHIDELAGEGLI